MTREMPVIYVVYKPTNHTSGHYVVRYMGKDIAWCPDLASARRVVDKLDEEASHLV